MSDTQASAQDPGGKPPETDLTEELGNLGKNLVGILQAAWDRPERQKLQQEIEGGLSELGATLRKEAKAVSENPVSQRIKTEVGDLGTRVRSGQVDARVREELVGALHALNAELEKVTNILAADTTSEAAGVEESPATEAPAPGSQNPPKNSAEASGKGKTRAKRKAKPEASTISSESGAAPGVDSQEAD
jgi:hypothetical protein